MAEMTASFRSMGAKILPHLGFIYFTLMLTGITAAVFLITQTIQSTDIGQGTATNQKLSEYAIPSDQATISKVKALSENTTSSSTALPGGRINPFSESVY